MNILKPLNCTLKKKKNASVHKADNPIINIQGKGCNKILSISGCVAATVGPEEAASAFT